ncbi:uncharacterized protein LOC122133818 [Clupea harengus]|uniref:Uncharacterized protein LOC122133818 n=1 Tax=Clupea harengus TaxID=7950 RepID=A0A8M1KYH1_CLUHA|nr:uncharacterized protein LOC122133818 [Clupea harengus]
MLIRLFNTMSQCASSNDHGQKTKKRKANAQDKSGCKSLTDRLSVQPKSTPSLQLASTSCDSFICQGTSPFSPPPPPNTCTGLQMEETAHNFLRTTEHNLSHSSTLNAPVQPEPTSHVPLYPHSHQINPQSLSHTLNHGALSGDMDPLFIRAATVVEMVCGERMYKCSACLHYYTGLGPLVEHVKEGWRDGFSCRVFYRKLKSMWDRRVSTDVTTGIQAATTVSGCTLPLSGTTTTTTTTTTMLAATATDSVNSHTVKDKKMERVQDWLEKSVILPQ